MELSNEVRESFARHLAELDDANRAAEEQEQLKLVNTQIRRAAMIALNGRRNISNGETITYDTPWANIAYDSETDTITQARLHGVFKVKRRLFIGDLLCVQFYLRPAKIDTPTAPEMFEDFDYAALFNARSVEITVPNESYPEAEPFPFEGELVLPGSKKWNELDYALTQIGTVVR